MHMEQARREGSRGSCKLLPLVACIKLRDQDHAGRKLACPEVCYIQSGCAKKVARHDLLTSMHTLSILCASSKTTIHSFSSSLDTMLDTCRQANDQLEGGSGGGEGGRGGCRHGIAGIYIWHAASGTETNGLSPAERSTTLQPRVARQ